MTVSPLDAEFIVDCTSTKEHEGALRVLARAFGPENALKRHANNSHFTILIIGSTLSRDLQVLGHPAERGSHLRYLAPRAQRVNTVPGDSFGTGASVGDRPVP
jgi:hypothetical protein